VLRKGGLAFDHLDILTAGVERLRSKAEVHVAAGLPARRALHPATAAAHLRGRARAACRQERLSNPDAFGAVPRGGGTRRGRLESSPHGISGCASRRRRRSFPEPSARAADRSGRLTPGAQATACRRRESAHLPSTHAPWTSPASPAAATPLGRRRSSR
jgi:hypothetical protein